MRRRTFLATTALAASSLAGCLGDDSSESDDGATPTPADADSFERIEVEGESVPLVPVDTTHDWHTEGTAKFADARGRGQYDEAHIEGAAWSPVPDGREDDPVASWETDERIVCYVKDRRKAPSFRAGIRVVYFRPTLPILIPAGVGHSITQQGQKLAVGLGSARTMEAITPFPHGRLRGRRDAVAATSKKQSSPGWS